MAGLRLSSDKVFVLVLKVTTNLAVTYPNHDAYRHPPGYLARKL